MKQRIAGRELDADVIEALGGRGRMTVYAWQDRGKKEKPLTIFTRPPLTDTSWEKAVCEASYNTFATDDGKRWPHNAYVAKHVSTDISAAFQVVEAMREKGWGFSMHTGREGQWEARFASMEGFRAIWRSAVAETPALAVCLCALKALEATTPQSAVPTQG